MADITTMPFGAAEHCRLDNWAAEYAKKLFVAEAASRTEAITQEVIDRNSAINKAVGDEKSERKAAVEALEASKADKTVYASTTQAGLIKLHKGGSGNNSGLEVDQSDGTAYVKTSEIYGTKRDGVGQIQIAAATEGEIDSAKQQYKPIVPATVKRAVENITGKASDLPEVRLDSDSSGGYIYYRATDLVDTAVNLNRAINEERAAREAAVSETKSEMDSFITPMWLWRAAPQQIGTWEIPAPATIPPTMPKIYPVWRVQIPLTALTALGYDITTSFSVSVSDLLAGRGIVKNTDDVVLVDQRLYFQNEASHITDAFAGGVTEAGHGSYLVAPDDTDQATHVYGWAEFATPFSNIVTS